MDKSRQSQLDDLKVKWIDRLRERNLVRGDVRALEAEFEGWLSLLANEANPETSRAELDRLVSLHAREHGEAGRPASFAIQEILALEDILSVSESNNAALKGRLRALLPVAADSCAAGRAARTHRQLIQTLRKGAPIIRFNEHTVLGFLIGPMEADNIDPLVGRLLREGVRAQAKQVILDVTGADQDNDLFHRTLLGITESPLQNRLTVYVTGLRSPRNTERGLVRLGCPLDRIHLSEDLGPVLQDKVILE